MSKNSDRLKRFAAYSEGHSFEEFADALMEDHTKHDHLGFAAHAKDEAKAATKRGDFDAAWGFYHEQKSHYMQYANSLDYSARQALALDAVVHENLANLLRLEGSHADALAHVIYWVSASSRRPSSKQSDKIRIYFGRCKLHNTQLKEVLAFARSHAADPDLREIQIQVSEWQDRG
jgi:hypothetical protein